MAVNRLQKQRGRGPGRPVGARNAATQLAEALLDGEAAALTQKLVLDRRVAAFAHQVEEAARENVTAENSHASPA